MTYGDRPVFSVVVGTTIAERRLIPLSVIRAFSGLTEDDIGDEALNLRTDAVLALCARSCRMARAGSAPATLAREQVRAVWPDVSIYNYNWRRTYLPNGRGNKLILPWRAPITSIAVAEGETDLVQDTDFRYLGSGVIERIGVGDSYFWPTTGEVTVDYTAGFIATPADASYDEEEGDPLPQDVVMLIAQQVKMGIDAMEIDQNLRSEDVPGIWSGSYNVAGGDAIDTSGLLRPLYDVLSNYRAPPSFA